MSIAEFDKDKLADARQVGRAMMAMVRLWERAPLPFPFRLPEDASWRGSGSAAMEPDYVDGEDETESAGPQTNTMASLRASSIAASPEDDDAGSVGEKWSVGRLRATCAVLVHGDPHIQALVKAALNGNQQKENING